MRSVYQTRQSLSPAHLRIMRPRWTSLSSARCWVARPALRSAPQLRRRGCPPAAPCVWRPMVQAGDALLPQEPVGGRSGGRLAQSPPGPPTAFSGCQFARRCACARPPSNSSGTPAVREPSGGSGRAGTCRKAATERSPWDDADALLPAGRKYLALYVSLHGEYSCRA